MKKIKEYLLLKNPGILAMGFVFIMMLIFFPLESLLNFAILSLAMAFILFFISFMTEFDEDNPVFLQFAISSFIISFIIMLFFNTHYIKTIKKDIKLNKYTIIYKNYKKI